MATSDCVSDTKVLQTQNRPSIMGIHDGADGPWLTSQAIAAWLVGVPQVTSRSTLQPRRCKAGVIQPQAQKLSSMARLMPNKPVAEAMGVWPATCTIHGPALGRDAVRKTRREQGAGIAFGGHTITNAKPAPMQAGSAANALHRATIRRRVITACQ